MCRRQWRRARRVTMPKLPASRREGYQGRLKIGRQIQTPSLEIRQFGRLTLYVLEVITQDELQNATRFALKIV
jgi:hypothetical protein